MPTPDQMIAAVHGYVEAFDKADPELAVALFAADAAVEDPVGTPPKVGTEAIREFYTMSMQTGAKLHLDGPVRVGEDYAAFSFQVRLTMDGKTMTVDVIDIFRFNADGKVAKMEAYFGPTNFGAAE
jgi:steroid delta-isomerase